jgi:uncharacterized membrane protein
MQPSDFPETTVDAPAAADLEHDRFAMERLVLFSDAVYAIIITLLALDVRLPEKGDGTSLSSQLIETLPKLGSYALSFVVVSALWRVHLKRFRYFVAIDSRVITGNMLQLLLTGLMPFSTSVLNEHAGTLAVIVYAGNIIAISAVAWLTWAYARRRPTLVSPRLTSLISRADDRRTFLTVGVFALSMIVAWWGRSWATLTWLLLLPGNAWLSQIDRREAAQERAASQGDTVRP